MTSELPAYAVPGIASESRSGKPGVVYRVDQLSGCPVVAAAVERAPRVMPAISSDDEWMRETFAQTPELLCQQLWVITGDGLHWRLTFRDGVKFIVDMHDQPSANLFRDALQQHPHVVSADAHDIEDYEVETDRVIRADEMAAHFLDSVVAAHRAYARHRGIEMPG